MALSRPCTRRSSGGPPGTYGTTESSEVPAAAPLQRPMQRLQVQVPATARRTSNRAPVTVSTQPGQRPRSASQIKRSHMAVSTSTEPSCFHSAAVVPPRSSFESRSRSAGVPPCAGAGNAVASTAALLPAAPATAAPAAAVRTQGICGAWCRQRTTPPERPPLRLLPSSTASSPPAPPASPQPKAARKEAKAPRSRRARGAGARPRLLSAASQAESGAGPSGGRRASWSSAFSSAAFSSSASVSVSMAVSPSRRERHVTQATRCFSWAARGAATCSARARPAGP
mmetsp:Transcript_27693/g.58554  ORF Transcript_27693/g.58554 Transcript_27693/m.58554 type:complete len:284 (+) Transcript_27693:494-1345(+)